MCGEGGGEQGMGLCFQDLDWDFRAIWRGLELGICLYDIYNVYDSQWIILPYIAL